MFVYVCFCFFVLFLDRSLGGNERGIVNDYIYDSVSSTLHFLERRTVKSLREYAFEMK